MERLVSGGWGLARLASGKVVLVEGGLPGDHLVVAAGAEHPGHVEASVVEVLTPGPDRQVPPCPAVAAGCGGCDLQHARADSQRHLKAEVVTDALRRLGGIEGAEVALGPELPALGYRTTLRCVVVGERLGFRHRRSHEPVAVASCPVAHPLVDELVRAGGFRGAREVTLRCGARTGERLVIAEPTARRWEVPAGVGVVGADDLARRPRAGAFHEVVAGRRYRVSGPSFFQPSPEGAEALVALVTEAARPFLVSGARVVDLYGGVGLFAGALVDAAATRGVTDMAVAVVERGRSAAGDARANLKDLGVEVVNAPVERWRPGPAELVVADPARTGLGAKGVQVVARTGAERVVLVSCDAASAGRDAGLLGEAGYDLGSVTLVDQFPMTSHVEVVAVFDRR